MNFTYAYVCIERGRTSHICKSYTFASYRTERKEVTVRFKSAVAFGKFWLLLSVTNRCYFRFYTVTALWVARVTVKNFDRVKAGKMFREKVFLLRQ